MVSATDVDFWSARGLARYRFLETPAMSCRGLRQVGLRQVSGYWSPRLIWPRAMGAFGPATAWRQGAFMDLPEPLSRYGPILRHEDRVTSEVSTGGSPPDTG